MGPREGEEEGVGEEGVREEEAVEGEGLGGEGVEEGEGVGRWSLARSRHC